MRPLFIQVYPDKFLDKNDGVHFLNICDVHRISLLGTGKIKFLCNSLNKGQNAPDAWYADYAIAGPILKKYGIFMVEDKKVTDDPYRKEGTERPKIPTGTFKSTTKREPY